MRNQDDRKTYYMGGKPYYGIPPKNSEEAEKPVKPVKSVKQNRKKLERPQSKKAEYTKTTVYDAAYISYVENGESAAVFITRDIAENIQTKGKWIDVISSDGHKNKHNRWDFKVFTVEIFPRHKHPVYPKDASDEDIKYITWKTAREDIDEQREKGVKGPKFRIYPKLIYKNKGQGKPEWTYEILKIDPV